MDFEVIQPNPDAQRIELLERMAREVEKEFKQTFGTRGVEVAEHVNLFECHYRLKEVRRSKADESYFIVRWEFQLADSAQVECQSVMTLHRVWVRSEPTALVHESEFADEGMLLDKLRLFMVSNQMQYAEFGERLQ